MDLTTLKQRIQSSRVAGYIDNVAMNFDNLTIETDVKFLNSIINFLYNDCNFKILIDIFGVDYLDQNKRFNVIYNLLSLRHNLRLCIKIYVDEATPVPSIIKLYSAACWYEREVYDMYGVKFLGNPSMGRILSDYDFEGHPLRKDFPLTGYLEVRYDIEKKKVTYEPVQLEQEFRNFDFLSPWEGMEYPDESNNQE
ncbi:NADH-quinone oxidoreductase subunit C [Rickettsiales bacterium]|nr:NADH-quinone oxidoreductase subunit C [Rickettsiales bacterium]